MFCRLMGRSSRHVKYTTLNIRIPPLIKITGISRQNRNVKTPVMMTAQLELKRLEFQEEYLVISPKNSVTEIYEYRHSTGPYRQT